MPNPNLEFRISRCPHCGKVLEGGFTSPYEYGSPRMVCKNCGKQHFDGFYREKALVEYRERAPMWNIWLCVAFVGYALYLDYSVLRMERSSIMPETAIISIFLTIMSIALLLVALHRKENRDKYVADREKKLEDRFRNAEQMDKEFSASLKRLSNEDYLYYLIENEVDVPDYFFHSIDCVPDISRITEMKELCKVYTKERKRRERVHELRRRAEYYGEALALGKNSIIFRQQAQSKGMSPEAFEDYCRRMLDECREEIKSIENA